MRLALTLLAVTLLGADDAPLPKVAPCRMPNDPVARETWRLSLPQAIEIGLSNAETIRAVGLPRPISISNCFGPGPAGIVIPASKGIAICPVQKLDAQGLSRFRSESMAMLRSIEQQYWSLAQQHVQLWAAQKAVEMGEEILKQEQSELEGGRGAVADVAEVAQRLEQLHGALVIKTSDVITTEKQLRKILGLPLSDDRRIIPCTSPLLAKLEPEWAPSLAAMLENQPDVLQARMLVKQAEEKARDCDSEIIQTVLPELLELDPKVVTPKESPEDLVLKRQRKFLEQVVHQTTHSLARFFLEIDANYKQYQAARKLAEAAMKRLEAQRAFYEEGRITIDRLMDAIVAYTNAIAQEAQFKTSYNVSIVAFEEAKGTLLDHDGITIAETAKPSPEGNPNTDPGMQKTSHEADSPSPAPVTKAGVVGTTTSFQLTVTVGGKPVEIRGSFTTSPTSTEKATTSKP
jgi:hypothetical protein